MIEDGVSAAVGQSQDIWPFLLYSATVVGLITVTMVASWFIGSKARHGGAQDIPYESGIVPVGEAEEMRLSIEFFLVAMLFVVFDLEAIFIVGWAIAFFELGWRGYIGAGIFILILVVGLIYELSTGVLDWGVKRRSPKPGAYASIRS